ncbi:copper chaperone PCu(A)C [Nocardia sp. CDC160]|uniref:copper chaperone PCu(A)C n=1 Tax=Nocardia sp. CDC160 TaxID=3112166 RepID=UPI002DB929A5|nr:copper chaperone PCu(A)C [Nocardia sp. CDC160]MEC3917326.1 copper chaperone PCu(A)C [Nocardia sp. CDC160]
MPLCHSFRLRTGGFARRLGAAAALTTLALLPVACSNSQTASDASAKAADSVHFSDQWIKAADSGMSAAFGTLSNASDKPINLVAATSPASATVEIHEVVPDGAGEKTMRPKAGGIVIPAHGSATLKPGGDHLMFMGLKAPLRTGADTPITLTFSDGSTTTVTAQVRDFAGGKENYQPSGDNAAHGG